MRPISAYLASEVTRGSASPASRPQARTSSTASGNPSIPAPASLASTAPSSLGSSALGGSAHSGSGIRSTLRLLRRSEMTDTARPFSPRRSRASSAARSSISSSSVLATRRSSKTGPTEVSSYTSEPRLQATMIRPGPCGRSSSCPSTLPMCVPVMTARSKPASSNSANSVRSSLASALRSVTAVPSQSNIAASNRRSSAAAEPSASASLEVTRMAPGNCVERSSASSVGGTFPTLGLSATRFFA